MTVQREKQIAEAEEILGDSLADRGFAKSLFFGNYAAERLPAYPQLSGDKALANQVSELREYCRAAIDPVAIDRIARIPDEVIQGLGRLGVLGACLPKEIGGQGLTQAAYCRILEVLGGHCGSTALFVNAHHSIGPRAIVLFGTEEQRRRWLPKLATGEWISAFALTEPQAGSDAANVQTTAMPTSDGRGYLLNGEKRWITNGGIAHVLTVMARTPTPDGKSSKITAFLVTPEMPGFHVEEERMEKLGVRGTATSRLAFRDLHVPQENVLGEVGKGLRVALTVLDFGRTTFGASCTGAAKFCLEKARAHVQQRVQFQRPLVEFELVREKLVAMQAGIFAMEACTYQTAALIDAGEGDFMLETAMLKVFSTEVLWKILNDAFQLYGGKAYFTDEPFERMLRDARINMIGEGANDVLRVFTALVGMRDVGLELESIYNGLANPMANLGRLAAFAGRQLSALVLPPPITVRSGELEDDALRLARLIGSFSRDVQRLLATYQKGVVERQLPVARIADVATELYVSACVLRRLDAMLAGVDNGDGGANPTEIAAGKYYLLTADRRMRRWLGELWDNEDAETRDLARKMLGEVRT